jgi:hypothetical protein
MAEFEGWLMMISAQDFKPCACIDNLDEKNLALISDRADCAEVALSEKPCGRRSTGPQARPVLKRIMGRAGWAAEWRGCFEIMSCWRLREPAKTPRPRLLPGDGDELVTRNINR